VGWLLIALAACGEPPAPVLGQLSPNIVCGSGLLPLTLSGENFLARPVRTVHGGAALEVPSVSLEPQSGSAVFPDVTWLSSEQLSLSVPLDQLVSGSYSLTLTDPDGQTTHGDGVLMRVEVPPVTITSIAPSETCVDGADQTLTVAGMGFDPAAVVSVRNAAGAVVLAPMVSLSATSITVTLPKGSLASGSYTLVIANPSMNGCQVTAAQPITIAAPPTLRRVTPNQICAAGARLVVSGTGFEDGATVQLTDGTAHVTATDVRVTSPTTATLTFGANTLPKNSQADLVWTNPDGCAVTLQKAVRVKAGQGGCN
jgi:IPT/TIG domain